MTRPLRKIYLAITGMLMAFTAQSNGSEYYPPFCGSPCCDILQSGFSVKGEALYWRPTLTGLDAAFGNTTLATSASVGGVVTTTTTEIDKQPTSKWNTGYRVGANLLFNCIDIEADYTHFNGHANFRDRPQNGRWKIKYDVIDLTIGRRFYPTPNFYVEPYIGARGARIHQSLQSHLAVLFTSPLPIGDHTNFIDMDDKEHFWGVAPEVGVEINWCLGWNLSFFADFDIVNYYGNVRGRYDTLTQTLLHQL